MKDVIERVESAAEFLLYGECEEDAFPLYALFLKWVLDHNGPFCQCACKLVHRARVGCALSALARSDLEVANALLKQTETLSPLQDRQSLASWLFYEAMFTWKLYISRGLLSSHVKWDCVRRFGYHLNALFNVSLYGLAGAAWLDLGVMLCEELSPIIKDSDAAKGYL
jgi:hypothetical protein